MPEPQLATFALLHPVCLISWGITPFQFPTPEFVSLELSRGLHFTAGLLLLEREGNFDDCCSLLTDVPIDNAIHPTCSHEAIPTYRYHHTLFDFSYPSPVKLGGTGEDPPRHVDIEDGGDH